MAVSSVQRDAKQSPNSCWSLISRKSSAFTVAELLVAIAIIGVLLSLLIPAVQQTREAARRSQCVSQMKQIGLAIHNYETLWRSFPQHDLNTSYLVHILPQLEMGSILNRYNPYLVYDPLAPNSGRNGLLWPDPIFCTKGYESWGGRGWAEPKGPLYGWSGEAGGAEGSARSVAEAIQRAANSAGAW